MEEMAQNHIEENWRVEVENIEVTYGSFEGPAHRARVRSEYHCDLLLDGVKAARVSVESGEYVFIEEDFGLMAQWKKLVSSEARQTGPKELQMSKAVLMECEMERRVEAAVNRKMGWT